MLDKNYCLAFFIHQKIPVDVVMQNPEGRCTGRAGEILWGWVTLVQDSLNHTFILQKGTDTLIAESSGNDPIFPVLIDPVDGLTLFNHPDLRVIYNQD